MSGLKDLAKGGWHPKGKDGGKESWRGDFKGIDTVAGWVGKGKKNNAYDEAQNHQTTPLGALKDPSSFGPPPKRTTGGTPGSPSTARVGTGGLGVEEDRQRQFAREEAAHQAAEEPAPPPGPYKVDTTGLNTATLPKPPVFRGANRSDSTPTDSSNKLKPTLPPRLPPRGAQPATKTPIAPPPSINDSSDPSASSLNQGAINRLGSVGVSVPGFNIGGKTSPTVPARNISMSPPLPARGNYTSSPPISPLQSGSQLGELQSRFSKMNTGSSATPSTGTTWAQKQAALKTASDFRKDPSTVSLSDAREVASTANNFRERHGEQVATGWKAANGLNQKYGVMDKMKSYTSEESPSSPTSSMSPAAGKKAPPPPPAKKKGMQGPPPIPLGSKPTS